MNMLRRDLELDAARADAKKRRVPAVLSTTFPVEREGYVEVLLHGRENVDLSRAPLPLIESHDGRTLNIGLVENLRLADGKLRGDVVFGTSQRANELWPDVEAGIVRNLSVGYRITDFQWRGETLEAKRWQPFETSLVSIPADPNAGTYRSYSMHNDEGESVANADNTLTRRERRELHRETAGLNQSANTERARVLEITAIARQYDRYDLGDVAEHAIREGLSVAEFKARAMDKMANGPMAISNGHRRDQPEREYSIVRAIAGAIDQRVDNGFEREVSQELGRALGRQPRGIFMPVGRLTERTLSVAGAAALVGEQNLGSEFIDALRNRSFVMQLGARVLSGLTEDLSIPRLTASSTAGWIAGDGTDGLTESTPTVDAVTLKPKTVGALTVLSRKMVLQGNPDAESMVRNDFAQLIAVELDRAAINGSGVANQPIGVINTAGVSTGTYPLAGPDFASMLAMEAALMADNADQGSLAYLTTPALAAVLKGKETAAGSGVFVWSAGRERGQGSMVGLPAFATSNVPLDRVILGNWADLLMGLWGAVDIEVNPYHDFSKGNVGVRVFASVDFAVRHPESFAVYTRSAT